MGKFTRSFEIVASLILIAAFLLPALQGVIASAATFPTSVSGNVIKIGMPISLTGKFATEGTQALCGAEAAIKWFNDHGGITVNGKKYMLQLVYYDDQSSSSLVPTLVSKLITQDHVNFLLAPYSSGLTAAAAPVAEQYKVIMLSHGGASNTIFQQGYKYLVQILSPASMYFKGTLDLIKKYIPDAKIAFIYANEPFAKAVIAGARDYAKKLGLNVVYDKAYETSTTDFSPFITAAMRAGANVLVGGGHYEDGKALVKQAHDLGWHLKFISILVAPAQPKFYEELDGIANGVAVPVQWSPELNYNPDMAKQLGIEWFGPTNSEWIQLFHQLCPKIAAPAYQAAEAGASIVFLVKAIEKAGSLSNDAVRQAMNSLDILTYYGRLKIDPKTGLQIGHEMALAQWQNGKLQVIWPESVAKAKPMIAISEWWPATTHTTTTTMHTTTSTTTVAKTTTTSTQTTTTKAKSRTGAIIAAVIIIIIIIAIVAVWVARR